MQNYYSRHLNKSFFYFLVIKEMQDISVYESTCYEIRDSFVSYENIISQNAFRSI